MIGQAQPPVHSPVWQMRFDLGSSGRWRIRSEGIILIDSNAYTDSHIADKDPSAVLAELVQRYQVP
jgi:hypothetical protein